MKFYKLFFLFSVLLFASCKKNDITTYKGYFNEGKFFTTKPGTDPLMHRIIDELKLQSTKNPNLIELISSKHGYPVWDKSRKIGKHELQHFGEAAGDTIVYIPLAPEGEDKVSAFFYVILKGSISIQLYNKYDYEQFGFDTLVSNNSHNLALQFMILDYLSFGHKDFKILDERILKDFDIHPDIPAEDRTVHIDNLEKIDLGRGIEQWTVSICTNVRYLKCSSGRCCSDGSCGACADAGCWKTKISCKTSYISVYNDGSLDAGGGGGSPYNPPFPEGGGVGGGEHSGTVSTIPQQCNPTPLIVNGLPPCTKGNGLGWEVVELNQNSYNLTWLKNMLELNFTQQEFLSGQPELINQLINYLNSNSSPQEKQAISLSHINRMIEDQKYFLFVQNHLIEYNTNSGVWWENDRIISQFNFNVGEDPYNFYGELTAQEKELIKLFPVEAFIMGIINKPKAISMSRSKFVEGGLNDKHDAFRHAYFNALNSRDCRPDIVFRFANAHESEVPQQLILEKQMDTHNNIVGINYCSTCNLFTSDVSIANGIINKLINGELVYLKPVEPTPDTGNGINNDFWQINGNPKLGKHGINEYTQIVRTNE